MKMLKCQNEPADSHLSSIQHYGYYPNDLLIIMLIIILRRNGTQNQSFTCTSDTYVEAFEHIYERSNTCLCISLSRLSTLFGI